jgi:hypothetical protein
MACRRIRVHIRNLARQDDAAHFGAASRLKENQRSRQGRKHSAQARPSVSLAHRQHVKIDTDNDNDIVLARVGI